MTDHAGLPVEGYKPQSHNNIERVNANKRHEEELLRVLDAMMLPASDDDRRWVALARTHFEQGFMAMNRAIFKPGRVQLPSDVNNGD